MADLIQVGDVGGVPEFQCSECDVIWSCFWNRNGFTERIEYCAFCGDEINDTILLTTPTDPIE